MSLSLLISFLKNLYIYKRLVDGCRGLCKQENRCSIMLNSSQNTNGKLPKPSRLPLTIKRLELIVENRSQ